jgi:hypothetical protein
MRALQVKNAEPSSPSFFLQVNNNLMHEASGMSACMYRIPGVMTQTIKHHTMSQQKQPIQLQSEDYRTEIAKQIAQWLPPARLVGPDSPSGLVSIKIRNFFSDDIHFTVRQPDGAIREWIISWQRLWAFGALKQSSN